MNRNWQLLKKTAYDKVWSFIYEQLGFQPYSQQIIQLPMPVETKNIAEFDNSFQEMYYDNLHESMKMIFQEITAEEERMLALNWQHDCYSFDPRLPFEKDEFDEWLISVFPNGDHVFFLTADFQNIYYGDGLHQTVSISGDKLLKATNNYKPLIFST